MPSRANDVLVAPGTGGGSPVPSGPVGARGGSRKPSRHKHNKVGYLFLLPWLVGIFGLTLLPMLYSLFLSFTEFDLLSPPRWAGLENYDRMFTDDPRFMQSVKVTLIYVAISVPLKLVFALAVAMALNRGLRALGLYRAVFYLPSLLGASVAVAVMWRQIFSQDGLLNQVLKVFGVTGPDWIGTPDYALGTLILLAAWQFGTPMLIFLAGLKQLPQEVFEAAELDGARRLRLFFSITIPLLSPMIFFNLVLETINAFQTFTPAFVVSGGSGGPIDSTLLYTLYLYQQGFTSLRMGYASAMAWVLFIVIALFTSIYFATSRRWVHYGD
jgi:multiple sugar transport system permease protein